MSLLKGIKSLETAYKTKDWDMVRESYRLISGEELDYPEETTVQPHKKKSVKTKKAKINPAVIENVGAFNSFDFGEIFDVKAVKLVSGPVKANQNQFLDDGVSHSEDKKIDELLKKGLGGKGWKKGDKRESSNIVEVDCITCKKKLSMPSELFIKDSKYYCEQCLATKGK